MQRIKWVIFLLFVTTSVFAATASITVVGIKGKLLANVVSRLKELGDNQSLGNTSDHDLTNQVLKAMQPYGFFKPIITIKRTKTGRTVIVNAGTPSIISEVKIELVGEGASNPKILAAINTVPLIKGTRFDTTQYDKAKQRLLTAAEDQGYLKASFEKAEILIDEEHYTVTVHLIFNTGTQFFFGQVQFNPTYINPELLRRYIPFKYGEPYSTDQILAFNNTLSSSGYFKTVNITPDTSASALIPITVNLEPATRINYSLGLGFGTDTGIRGRAGLHVVPVNQQGHKFNAILMGSQLESALQTQYIIPGLNPLTDQYEIVGNVANLNYDAGYGNSALLTLGQRHTVPHFQRVLSINSLYERFNYTYQPKVAQYSLYPKASFTWLSNANELFVPNGYKVVLTGLAANKAVFSQINYSQVLLDAKAAIMFKRFGTRLYFHTIQGVTQVNDIYQFPLTLAQLLGGSDDLKGYDYNSIGPGKIVTYSGFELQQETKENWFVIGFLDSGDVFKPVPRSLKKDVGIGLMWLSPVGPIKIGVAQAVDNHFNRQEKPKLVINVGPDL